MRAGILVLTVSLAGPTLAGEFSLSSPIDCELGEDRQCYIQSYPDRDPGPDFHDFACHSLSYDGHKGTDFALRSHAQISQNIGVLAAADGVVKGTRDGMADKVYKTEDADSIAGRDCGNGLVIDHGDGWETQYCHLRQGSVAVRSNQKVTAGTYLGDVGMSGRAQFPHLHLSVRQDGTPVDPFFPGTSQTCQMNPAETLWADPIVYQAGGLIAAGFSGTVPTYTDIIAGKATVSTLSQDSAALVLWGFVFGSRAGDILRLTITDPVHSEILIKDVKLEKAQAQLFRAAGRKTISAPWFQPGVYSGTVQLVRDGAVISDLNTEVTVRD